MTLAMYGPARNVQRLGLLGAVLGVIATQLAPSCGSVIWVLAGIVAIGFDIVAVAGRGHGSIPASILKAVMVILPMGVLLSCAYVDLPEPIVPAGLGPMLLMLSAIPSLLGAFLRWRER